MAPRHTRAWPHGASPLADAASDAASMRFVPGASVPGTRFRIRRLLGEGGMGVVYEAEHVDLERPVALKILRREVASLPEERERFRQEARLTTQIASPYVIGVLDFGFLFDGRAYYAMELFSGHSLADEVERAPVPMPRVIGLMRQMCAGLHAAHVAGVIHRDCKPENAMVVVDRMGRDCIKLLDFGIASPRRDEGEARMCGTPEYMAPEQIEGVAFDGRLDQYALACTVYALLTGEPPFHAQNVATVLQWHVDRPPLPPSARRPELAEFPAIEAVIMRCLAKDPDQRYRDMAEVEIALCEAQISDGLRTEWDDLALPNVDSPRREALSERMSKRRRSSRAAGLVRWAAPPVVALLAVAAWFTGTSIREVDRMQIEELVEQARAAATSGRPTGPRVRAQPEPSSEPELEATEALVVVAPTDPGDLAVDLAPMRAAGGTTRSTRERATVRAERTARKGTRGLASALAGLSDAYFAAGDLDRALSYARRAASAEPLNAEHFVRVGDAHYKLLDYDAARRSYRKAGRLGHARASARLRRIQRERAS